ncbi:MAG TPA: cob(I)yrinic acid a,c-diamide adenosyltransferase [Candidatus Limenecus avicola]|uniref:Cob(I)yrinic acid a,c-diamide adenosyltransferase n=1 Tax=Candidatus Limenecus avicola TaxID=2840847 RepID=A0A9D1N1U4_9CLOT|nr:cob(I)yrinic acid a,c-diamide adenosyltransferase [Clostridium sp.]DAB26743.1 MAG TPA: cob(I)yrinic acid a,c-diamide adenosyltransferase [Candidatus Gastranaerophilales bacterium HUM_21]HIU93217.1 cob(I)yrinic acid a,c-diamide adenosyltransferase [Candidatus Limenecus avicola]
MNEIRISIYRTEDTTLLEHGYIQIYTGDGKGKTTASLGLALRALGHGWKVLVIQFTKGDSGTTYGEIASAGKFLKNLEVHQFGMDRVVYKHNVCMEDYKEAKKGWELAKQAIQSGEYQLVILDELNICVAMNMIKVSEVKDVLLNKPESLEIVLTGRYAHPELVALAHLVTEMKPIKHYFDMGVMARQGIEY